MKYVVSSSPHWHSGRSESAAHFTMILTLVPAVIFGIVMFGAHALRVVALSVATAMISEMAIRRMFRRASSLEDGSAILIGLLFAMLLPPSVPFWLVIVGSFLSILIGKEIFGGLGSNPLHPALVGWAILRISWPWYLDFNLMMANYDLSFDFHYPLTVLKSGGAEALGQFKLVGLLLGKQVGGIGATAIFLLLIGGIYLIIRRLIPWEIPVFFFGGVMVLSGLFWMLGKDQFANPLFHLLTGNVMLGAFFLATDYGSTPVRRWGRILFGFGCGIFVVILRVWSVYPDGVVFAVLMMNLCTPLLDRIGNKPKPIPMQFMEEA